MQCHHCVSTNSILYLIVILIEGSEIDNQNTRNVDHNPSLLVATNASLEPTLDLSISYFIPKGGTSRFLNPTECLIFPMRTGQ